MNTTDVMNTVFAFMPIAVIIGILVSVCRSVMTLGRSSGFGDTFGDTSSSVVDELEDITSYDAEKRMRLEAQRMLMLRLARGKISKEEYTEAMARL